MLYGKNNVSTRTLLNLTAVLLILLCGVGAASAANTGVAPQLVPYQAQAMAGNAKLPFGYEVAGYGGDGLAGPLATLSSPDVLAVDSVGNVYFADVGNALIREINGQTGVISSVAGTPPSACIGTVCSHVNPGCSEAVAAQGNPIGGSVHGIAIDAYGNLYFSDGITQTVSVIYRGGPQVAAFIKLVDPTGVATSNGVQPGFIYHVAGSVNLTNCAGTASASASSSKAAVPPGDGQLAYNGGTSAVTVTFGTVSALSLDSAGNLFIGDGGPNNVIRVINTQTTAQTFFGVSVQPGFIASIVNCGSLTQLCPPGAGNTPETVANTGVGGPAGAGVFNTLATGNGAWMSTDAYGNIYELNYKGATPAINLAVAYAGGTALGRLINNANQGAGAAVGGTIAGAAQLPPATVGDFYYILANITLRPSSVTADPFGNVYYEDNHYGQIYRIDTNASAWNSDFLEVSYLTSSGLTADSNRVTTGQSPTSAGTLPTFCYPASGQSATLPYTAGYMTNDDWGANCPVITAMGTGLPHSGTGYGTVVADGPGNLYIADRTNMQMRSVVLDNIFPTTPVGQQWNPTTYVGEQGLQVHFDQTNLPIQVANAPGSSGFATSSFSIAPGISDFTINPIEQQYVTGATPAVGGLSVGPTAFTYTPAGVAGTTNQSPVCANTTGSVDLSLDCVLNVIFSPTLPGLRQTQLVVTTANGSVYHYGLSGIGSGSQLAIDGGAQSVVALTGIGNPGQIAVTPEGSIYVADPANNRVVVMPAAGGTQTAVGTGLKAPMGVAVDASGNVFIADTGNNRVVEISQITGAQTVLGGILAPGTPSYTSYSFKAPQGLAVDLRGNVYVADTGNAKVVEIPSDPRLGGATPLLQYPGAPALVNPVALTLDVKGNVYVADSQSIQIIKIPAGGGDLQNLPGAVLSGFGSVLRTPSGVAIDAAGNIYVSDSTTSQVYELPSGSGLSSVTVPINFTGLSLGGGGGSLALDASGNLYVADTGNSRVLFENRTNPTVNCGLVAQGQPAATCGTSPLNGATGANTLTVTNIGNVAATVVSPFTTVTSPNASYSMTNNCPAGSPPAGGLAPGAFCTISPSFLPVADGVQTQIFTVNGTSQAVTLTGSGEQPLVKLVLSNTPTTGTGTAGSPITVTATLMGTSSTPTGAVTFSYTVNGGTPVVITPVPMASGSGGTSTASFTIAGSSVLQGHLYVVNATYQGDSLNSQTVATPLSIYVPGVPVSASATPITYTYGQAVPAIVGTVTGITDSSVTYKLVSAATASSPIGTYPITVVFSGGTAANYGYGPFPPVYATGSTTTPATVTEKPAALTVKANNATAPYGAADIPNSAVTYSSVVTGLVNGDKVAESYTPATSSILNVGTYPIVPTVIGAATGNYSVSVTNGTLTVTAAGTAITVAPTAVQILPANLAANPIVISVATQVAGGKGTPTGTVTLTDTFTPIIATAPGYGATAAPVAIGPLALVAGTVSYKITSLTPGTHVYSVAYSGDANFQPSTTVATTSVLVNNADFVVSAPATPIVVAPGVIPGGNNAVFGEQAATPETALVTVSSVLSYTGTIYLGCTPQSPSYVTCTLTPPVVSLTSTTATSTVAISTPATLPLGFFGEVRHPVSTTVLAFLPFGVLAFCMRRRRKLSRALWMLLAMAAIGTGVNGCADNSVHYFTPVPSGAQTVTVYACSIQSACTNPISGNGTGIIRSFTIPISIE